VTVLAWLAPAATAASQVTLLSASFDTDPNGFVYEDDAFGTSQPGYASGAWVASGGFGNTGGLQVTLGGVDANPVSDMSGGWSLTFDLAADESGVALAFRYKLDQSATYEYDEHTRMLVKVDGVQYGRRVQELYRPYRRRRLEHAGQQQYFSADHGLAEAPDLRGEPGRGSPHHRLGRLQQQEGCRGRALDGHDRRRVGDLRQLRAGSQ
jgi:hypothetical protein